MKSVFIFFPILSIFLMACSGRDPQPEKKKSAVQNATLPSASPGTVSSQTVPPDSSLADTSGIFKIGKKPYSFPKQRITAHYIADEKEMILYPCPTAAPPPLPKGSKGGRPDDVFKKVYADFQTLDIEIPNDKEITVSGISGSKLHFRPGTFCDSLGQFIKGDVVVSLTEALTPYDMVMANLTTLTADGHYLESGGMLCVSAACYAKPVKIAPGKSIEVSVPAKARLDGMQAYEGWKNPVSGQLEWLNPQPLEGNSEQLVKSANSTAAQSPDIQLSKAGDTSAALKKPRKLSGKSSSGRRKSDGRASGILTEDGNMITNDSFVQRGVNQYYVDSQAAYVFRMKRLGWANIDRLMNDPRTQAVSLQTNVEDADSFAYVYVSIIFKSKRLYIPGYLKKDGSYCFSHNDNEENRLPVGAKALIIATAFKNDMPYLATKEITISSDQTLSLRLEAMTLKELRNRLSREL
jgi:hypothetical protein